MTADPIVLPGDLAAAIHTARRLVVLTGAGMSAESGVPVFRGSGGLWEGFRPEDLATPQAFASDPARVWRWYRWRLDRVDEAQPHAGHHALAALERDGGFESFTLITQNVDGMHQRSGSTSVIELHGNITRARCEDDCGHTADAHEVDPAASACACGRGRLRPDVVWFGESLPVDAMDDAARALEEADMAWVVGTSSVVYPAAALPGIAARRGVPVVEINPDETPLSSQFPYSLRVAASAGLAALARARLGAGAF
jgi:NAD-dependent deacetylase